MKTKEIVLRYLTANGINTTLGDEPIVVEENKELPLNDTDKALGDSLLSNSSQKDIYLITMFAGLLLTFGVFLYKLITGPDELVVVGVLTALIFLIIAVMHRLWRDKIRAVMLMKIFPYLAKEDRIKVALEFLKDDSEVRLRTVWSAALKATAAKS